MIRTTIAILILLFAAAAFAQGPSLPFGFVPIASGGGTAPTVVQVIPAVTGGGTSGSVCNTFSATPQSITCTMATLGAGHRLIYSAVTSSTLTAINAPTCSGAGCSGVTWSSFGTATANGAAFISSTTSAGAATVTGTSTSSSGATLQATVREVTCSGCGIDGTPAIGTVVSSCTSCSAPSSSVALTTTVANDLVICDAIAGGSPGAMTMTGTFTQDLNTSGGLPEIGGHLVQATAGTVAKMTWTATSSAYHTNCYALEP
jgi:hypothetical protein